MMASGDARSYSGLPPTGGPAAAAVAVARVNTAAMAFGSSVNELIRRSALSASGATSLYPKSTATTGTLAARAVRTSIMVSPTMIARCTSPPARRMVSRNICGSDAECVWTADRCEIAVQIQSIEQAQRKPFQLVGANREPASFAGEPLEHAFEVRERARAVGNMCAVVVDEDPKHAIKLGNRHVSACGDQSSLDHAARAAADHAPRIIVGNRRQASAGKDEIERRN